MPAGEHRARPSLATTVTNWASAACSVLGVDGQDAGSRPSGSEPQGSVQNTSHNGSQNTPQNSPQNTPDIHAQRGSSRVPATAVAFSGGGDSVCLLAQAVAGQYGDAPVAALIVDHGLRPGSRADAEWAQAAAMELGVEARILTWDTPSTGASGRSGHAAARAGRHALLAEACAQVGARRLLLGHTQDDQLETALMRLARPSVSARGLAGLWPQSPSPAWPQGRGVELVRPMLTDSREQLRIQLRRQGRAWLDDPANGYARFERVRARCAIEQFSPDQRQALLAAVSAAQALDSQVQTVAWSRLRAMDDLGQGRLGLPLAAFHRLPNPVAMLMLDAALDAATGDPRPRRTDGGLRLLKALQRGARQTLTFAGAMVEVDPVVDRVCFSRDPGVVHGRAGGAGIGERVGHPGDCVVWDGRFALNVGQTPVRILAGENGAPRVHTWEGRVCEIETTWLGWDLLARRCHAGSARFEACDGA